MEFIIILTIFTIIYILLKFIFSVKIKKIKEYENDKDLDKIVSKYPENVEICK